LVPNTSVNSASNARKWHSDFLGIRMRNA
jgi:hypothetical protein